MSVARVPASRLRAANERGPRPEGSFVLYWMCAQRRPGWNPALERALELARDLDRPLVVLEALRAGYPHASERLHRFVLQGMRDNRAAFARAGVLHHAYVEPQPGAGKGLLETLARHACLVVADDSPAFFLPRMLAAAAARVPVRLEAVDGCGLLPLSRSERVFATAHAFRRHLQQRLPSELAWQPLADPLAAHGTRRLERLPAGVASRWPAASDALLAGEPAELARLPIDREVGPVGDEGGHRAAQRALAAFLERLERYADERNQPDSGAASGLSPWLHFGHLSPHAILAAVAAREGWAPDALDPAGGGAKGAREGWWGMSPSAEGFLDQVVTWRELGQHNAQLDPDFARYEGLPDWARRTLAAHEGDAREHLYEREAFRAAATHDPVWNAAQTELVRTGRMHNYLRMLWGKKVLEWTASPRDALAILFELNDRYALDGRDPNSATGITWCLGRYDRPWAPQRPIFGSVRWMSSENTRRKLRLGAYLERFGASATHPGRATAQGRLFER